MPDDTEKNHLVLLVTNRAVEEDEEDDDAGFRSNPKQRRFRETVEQCVSEKVIGLDKWIAAHRARHVHVARLADFRRDLIGFRTAIGIIHQRHDGFDHLRVRIVVLR